MKQLTSEQAIVFGESEAWKDMSLEDIAKFQMSQDCLCMPFDVFHNAIEKTLGRPVFTHEFGMNREGLMRELFDGAPKPSFEDIMNLIPEEKRVIVLATGE